MTFVCVCDLRGVIIIVRILPRYASVCEFIAAADILGRNCLTAKPPVHRTF